MRTNTFLLLASAIAASLTISHAAVISERTCTPTQHNGKLRVYEAVAGSSGGMLEADAWLGKASTGSDFPRDIPTSIEDTSSASFYFEGCPGGDPFWLYCTNCGASSGYAIVATMNADFDSNEEPDHWYVYNYQDADAPIPTTRREEQVAREPNWWQSKTWTWDVDGTFIRPVTYFENRTLQPPLYAVMVDNKYFQYTASATVPSTNPDAGENIYFALRWFDNL